MAGDRGENFLTIYSNDGNTVLRDSVDCGDDISTLQVTTEGIVSDKKGIVYTYSGSGIYKGVATYPNATAATYPVGTTFTFGNATPNDSVNEYLTLYIVEEEKPKPTRTFDLSTLNLSAGTHTITVKARASGYEDSPASNAVSYVVAGDTVQVSGTWYFNETLSLPANVISVGADGMLGETIFTLLTITPTEIVYKNASGEPDMVYLDGKWENQAYRTITFDGIQTVSKEFYEWLVANATRPISGTWKFNAKLSLISSITRFYVNFSANDKAYVSIQVSTYGMQYITSSIAIWAYEANVDNGTWTNEAYRTITFTDTQYVTQDFYEWFTANAVFAFTIDSTTYYAKEGMTWGEWVDSEYNTAGYYTNEFGNIYIIIGGGGEYIVNSANTSYNIGLNGTYTSRINTGLEPT